MSARTAVRVRASLAALAVAALLAGCSQVSALAPVGGDRITKLRIAAVDVLLADGVEIKVTPVCSTGDTQYDCEGSTMAGEPISVTGPVTGDLTMLLTVGDRTLHDGPVDPILEQNAQAGS